MFVWGGLPLFGCMLCRNPVAHSNLLILGWIEHFGLPDSASSVFGLKCLGMLLHSKHDRLQAS